MPERSDMPERSSITPDAPRGAGPLADAEPRGGPIDDPALADRSNPRWDDPTAPQPDAQPLANEDGTPNVMPPETIPPPSGTAALGSVPPEDQAARTLEGRDEPGSDNIREGRGGGTPNPALAEGGDHG